MVMVTVMVMVVVISKSQYYTVMNSTTVYSTSRKILIYPFCKASQPTAKLLLGFQPHNSLLSMLVHKRLRLGSAWLFNCYAIQIVFYKLIYNIMLNQFYISGERSAVQCTAICSTSLQLTVVELTELHCPTLHWITLYCNVLNMNIIQVYLPWIHFTT